MIESQRSVADYLIEIMPGLRSFKTTQGVNSAAADALYELWTQGGDATGVKKFKRPATLYGHLIDLAQDEGLVVRNGSEIEITDKGSEIIKIMVLGDDSSSFDKSQHNPTYLEAIQKTKPVTASKTKTASKAETKWWERFE